MYLSDKDIKKAVETKDIIIEEFDDSRLQPASYDILLGNKFIINDPHAISYIDPVRQIFPQTKEIEVSDDGIFVLHPGVSVLGTSWDYFGSDKYLIQLSGKSSLARIGLLIHNTAGLINPGHFLHITLELCNLNNVPIVLRPKMPIGQLLFSEMSQVPQHSYQETGRYYNNDWNSYIAPKMSKAKLKKSSAKVKSKTNKTKK